MATGPKMYEALWQATKALEQDSEFTINSNDAKDLCKLRPSDLMDRGYDRRTAKGVSTALNQGDVGRLGEAMGLNLAIDQETDPLLPDNDG